MYWGGNSNYTADSISLGNNGSLINSDSIYELAADEICTTQVDTELINQIKDGDASGLALWTELANSNNVDIKSEEQSGGIYEARLLVYYLGSCTNDSVQAGTLWVDSTYGNDEICVEDNDSLNPYKSLDTAFSMIKRGSLTGNVVVKIGPGTYALGNDIEYDLRDIPTAYDKRLIIEPIEFAQKPSDMPHITKVAQSSGRSNIFEIT